MIHQKKGNTQNPNKFQCQQKIGMIFGLPDLPKTQDVIQQLGFPITSITWFMSSWWWRASILGWGKRGSSDGMTWNSLHPVVWSMDDQRTPVVWVNWTFQPKNIPKTHFPDLCTIPYFFWWIHPTLWGGKLVFGSPSPQTYESPESILPSGQGKMHRPWVGS